ncbi:MAG TPA: TetR/AcrR family transcriptional regulator [Candidatus Binatia bacterium]|nr:TetR/AcrR family transcriptional regulator [Candidatus Binatia bacterium]
MNVKRSKAEQSELTQGALLKAARELFTEKGYADTATEEIVQRAGVTRGALYHHFRDKEELFQAVFEAAERELVETVRTAIGSAQIGPWEGLSVGCQAFLDACLEPTVQRIILLDAPAVLGWETWRRIDAEYGLGLVRQSLQAAIDTGYVAPLPVDPLAHILLGALNEAAMLIARAEDVQSARTEVGAVVNRLLKGLTAAKPTQRRKAKTSSRLVTL